MPASGVPPRPPGSATSVSTSDFIEYKLGNALHLRHERERLPELLDPTERLLDIESGSIGFHGPGILAITDRRLVHVLFRHLVRRYRVWSLDYERLNAIDARSLGNNAELVAWYEQTRVVYLPILGPPDRAEELRRLISEVAGLPE